MERRLRSGIGSTLVTIATVVAVATVGSVISNEASAQEAVAGEFDRLVEIIEGDSHRAYRLAAAHTIGELRTYLTPQQYSSRLLEAADSVDDPLVEFAVRRRAARAILEGGAESTTTDAEFADEQSCLVDWELVGPFENHSMQGVHEALAPELGEAGPYSGRYSEVDWRELRDGHHLCNYRLGSRVHPSTSAVVYLATTVDVEGPRDATLLVGTEGAYRVWVDGEPVGQRTAEQGQSVDAEGWAVELDGGTHEIVVKLASSGQGGLSWMARLVDADGQIFDNWSAEAGVESAEVSEFESVGMPDGGARMVIESGIASEDLSARLGAAMLWRQLYSEDSSTPWRNVADELHAQRDELSGRQLVWLSRLYEELWRRQALLDEAVEHYGDDRFVALHRARERGSGLARIDRQQQRAQLEELVDENPDYLMAVRSLARWFQRQEGPSRALRTLEAYDDADRHLRPAWVSMAARLHDQSGDRRRAAELRRDAAAVHRLSGVFGGTLIREAIAGDDYDEARELIDDYQQHAPWATTWSIRESMLWRAAGDVEAALAVIDDLVEQAPGDADLQRRRAALKLADGDRQGAIAAVEEAISLRPQATDHQKYLEHLQPESSRFYESWEITDLRELADETEETTSSYDRLVDQRIHQVASNGLSSEYVQRAHRVLGDEGVSGAARTRVSYRPGDERVEVLGVRVLKEDGTIAEDFQEWQTSRTRQGARQYNDRGYVNIRANNVDVGDIVEFRYITHQVANENFRGDYFGDIRYVQSTRPVGLSRYAVHYPEDWELYFRAPHHDYERWSDALPGGEPVEGQRVGAFELRDVPRVRTEDNQPGNTDVYDYIMVSNMESWDDVGDWWWELIEEQLVVDDAIAATVEDLVDGFDDDADRLEAIYEYVVQNTRYLHLGLGIHGWKPYRTSTVFRNRYGDCKDKAALLKVMLEEAGIDAEMVLVRTRRLGAVDEHPPGMNLFNHAAIYIPSMDRFVDPTAQYNGPWELTQMDQGAQALIVPDGGGGEFRTMPIDDADDNLIRHSFDVELGDETPILSGHIEAHGADAVRDRRRLEDEERRDEHFEDRLRSTFSGLSLLEAQYDNLDSLTEPSKIEFRAEVPDALRSSGDGQVIYPTVAARDLLDDFARQSTRRQDLTFRVPFRRKLEVRHHLPDGMTVERIPSETAVESDFGEMVLSYDYDGERLVVDVDYRFAVQRVDVDDYGEFRSFVAELDEALNETIRLVEVDDAT